MILALALEAVEVQSLLALDVVEEIAFDLDMVLYLISRFRCVLAATAVPHHSTGGV